MGRMTHRSSCPSPNLPQEMGSERGSTQRAVVSVGNQPFHRDFIHHGSRLLFVIAVVVRHFHGGRSRGQAAYEHVHGGALPQRRHCYHLYVQEIEASESVQEIEASEREGGATSAMLHWLLAEKTTLFNSRLLRNGADH